MQSKFSLLRYRRRETYSQKEERGFASSRLQERGGTESPGQRLWSWTLPGVSSLATNWMTERGHGAWFTFRCPTGDHCIKMDTQGPSLRLSGIPKACVLGAGIYWRSDFIHESCRGSRHYPILFLRELVSWCFEPSQAEDYIRAKSKPQFIS